MGDARIAELVAGSLHHRDGQVYRLAAFCIMPNHLHLVIVPLPKEDGVLHSLPAIMHSLKRYTARQANLLLGREGAFWQDESYDHVVRSEAEARRIIEYVLNNPVKAGLVQSLGRLAVEFCRPGCDPALTAACRTGCHPVLPPHSEIIDRIPVGGAMSGRMTSCLMPRVALMPDPIRYGLDNPHPLSQMKTELIWAGKYDATGRKVAPVRVKLPFQTVETVNESSQQRQFAARPFQHGPRGRVAQPPYLGR